MSLPTTCANIQRIRPVSAPLRQHNELPAPDKSLHYSMDSTLVSFKQAYAEKLHELVRTDYWGYSLDEKLISSDLHKIKYEVRK